MFIKTIKQLTKICILVLIVLLQNWCDKTGDAEPEEVILAKVGDKTISVSEFIARTEYTIRPNYCKGNYNVEKKIILNSLIAEKLLAIEAGDTNRLVQSDRFNRIIEGRKQQAMRQWLYHKEAVEKVELDSSEIKNLYQLAGRRYRVQFYNLFSDSLADVIGMMLKNDGELFDSIYYQLSGLDSVPEKEVDYFVRENEKIHSALFSKQLKVGDIIGPLRLDEGNYIVMKIGGWIASHLLSETEVSQRWNQVKEDLINQKARRIYENYVADVMRGKRLDFHPETFNKMVQIIGEQYFKARESEKERFLNEAFDRDTEEFIPDYSEEIDSIIDQPFFTVDGKTWTVADFGIEMQIHPLVFRDRRMSKKDFGNQLRFAIADLIRDKYLAEVAYKKGYDKANLVQRNVNMWRDADVALYYKSQYLKKVNCEKEDPLLQIQNYLNPHIDTLQHKYSDVIEVNVEEFDKIKLTRVDMFATQSNVPYPVLVPAFPQLTTDHNLDYGKEMEQKIR